MSLPDLNLSCFHNVFIYVSGPRKKLESPVNSNYIDNGNNIHIPRVELGTGMCASGFTGTKYMYTDIFTLIITANLGHLRRGRLGP